MPKRYFRTDQQDDCNDGDVSTLIVSSPFRLNIQRRFAETGTHFLEEVHADMATAERRQPEQLELTIIQSKFSATLSA